MNFTEWSSIQDGLVDSAILSSKTMIDNATQLDVVGVKNNKPKELEGVKT